TLRAVRRARRRRACRGGAGRSRGRRPEGPAPPSVASCRARGARRVPVLVTDAHTSVGARIVRRILEQGGEVRAFGAGVDGSLRAAGTSIATVAAADEGRPEAALEQAHTVSHPGVGLLGDHVDWAEMAATALASAAVNAGVQRIIALSILGA